MSVKEKDGFSTKIGFIFAAAGSAVGLGNLWKFPYLLGSNGGGIFLLVYLIVCLVVAFPCCLFESAIGRKLHIPNGTAAYAALAKEKGHSKAWGIIGFLGVLACLAMLFYYAVVGGWVMDYLAKAVVVGASDASTAADVFSATIAGPESIIWAIIFLGISALVVLGGIQKGIEKMSNFMMPALFIMLLIVMVRSLTLPGAAEGIVWMFKPDLSTVSDIGLGKVLMSALGQVFFSCSLGIGILITYGAYADAHQNMIQSSILVPVLDTAVALLASFAIIPAVFSAGLEPSQGPGLLFVVLPSIFSSFGPVLGRILTIIFFLLALFAAFTTSVAMIELPVNWLMDRFRLSRKKAVAIDAGITVVFCVLSALSYGNGAVSNIQILGKNIFDFFDYISATIMMPVAGFLGAIFVGYIIKPESLLDSITNHGEHRFGKLPMFWFKLCVKILIPIIILLIFLNGFGII